LRDFRGWALRLTAPLGVFAFWGGVLMAIHRYPSEYDWRFMTLSSLIYPERDPAGHLWAMAGVVICGLCGLSWAALLARQWKPDDPEQRPVGIWALRIGSFCMACCAMLPDRLVRVPKGHEILAVLAFFSLCIAMVNLTYHALGGGRIRAGLVATAALSPIMLAALTQAYVSHAFPGIPWVNLTWRDLGMPVYLSFAFWQWMTCIVFSLYIATLSLRSRSSNPRTRFGSSAASSMCR
jgi:hypothetical protein